MSYIYNFLEKMVTAWISRYANTVPLSPDKKNDLLPAVVVTGGGSGIGFALAEEFAAMGHTVVLVGRQEGRLKIAARDLTHKYGNRILALALDITQDDAADILMRWLALEGLYCDILVNNAGIGLSGPFMSCETKDLNQLMSLNMKSLAMLTRAFLPGMVGRARGGIMNIGSLGGVVPGPWQAVYYASKAFVLSFTEAIASEISGKGVRICVVVPGPVETRFHTLMGAEEARYRRFITATSPEKVAKSAIRWYFLGRRCIAPGIIPSLASYLLRIIPHSLSVPSTKWLLGNKNILDR